MEALGKLRSLVSTVLLAFVWLAAPAAWAECNPAPGTVIQQSNWQKYKDCFSEGVQYFWGGDGFGKMPDAVGIQVGQPHHWELPKPYVEATEKYGSQTRL